MGIMNYGIFLIMGNAGFSHQPYQGYDTGAIEILCRPPEEIGLRIPKTRNQNIQFQSREGATRLPYLQVYEGSNPIASKPIP